MALIILGPAEIVRDETDGLLYFSAVYRFTEEIAGVIDGEIRVPVGVMSDSEVVAQLQAAAAAHANLGTGGDNFTPVDVRVYLRSGGLSQSNAFTLFGSETDGVAIDFIDRTMIIKDVATPANDYSGLPTAKLTITRASTAYYLASTGLHVLAGINEARYDHYPGTLLPRGLLLEEARTNICLQSEAFATTWTASNVGVNPNNGPGMRGANTADHLIALAGNGTVTQAITATGIIPYTFSVWLERITGTGNIDISADGVTWVTVNVTATLTRFETTFTLSAAVYNPGIRIVTSGDEVAAWGAQLESGGYASSYIPTTTVAVTRSADNCSLSGTLFPLSQTAGTLILGGEYAGYKTSGGGNSYAGDITIGDGTLNERSMLDINNTTLGSRLFVSDEGDGLVYVTGFSAVINTVYKVGGVYAVNDFHHARGGVLAASPVTEGPLPTTTTMYIGGHTGVAVNCAWYRTAMYLPRRVTNAELQVLTT